MKEITNNQLADKVDQLSVKTDGLAELIRENAKAIQRNANAIQRNADAIQGNASRFDELMDFLREHMVTRDHLETRLAETKHDVLTIVDRKIANHTHKTA